MSALHHAASLSLALTLLVGGCDDYPRDPEDTLERVSGGTLRAGAIAAEPWVTWRPEGPAGVEVELVEELARTLDATVAWYRGTEHEAIDALEHRQLDIVVGGLTQSSPRRSVVGFTRPYLETEIVIMGRAADAVADIDGREVAAQPGTVIAAYVESEGAFRFSRQRMTRPRSQRVVRGRLTPLNCRSGGCEPRSTSLPYPPARTRGSLRSIVSSKAGPTSHASACESLANESAGAVSLAGRQEEVAPAR